MVNVIQRKKEDVFEIRDGRAMVSLGPLRPKKYCTYSCPFCYVHADFTSYGSLPTPKIIEWLCSQKSADFNIVCVSGDTDSFSPPRTTEGLDLLEHLLVLKKDIIFTTRMVFTNDQLSRLESISERAARMGNYVMGCVSIAQLMQPHLEPTPIPSPALRLEQLAAFRARGIVSILAMRPFLPVVPLKEYKRLLSLAVEKADVVLGEVWYADQAGLLENQVMGTKLQQFSHKKMDFDSNQSVWRIYEANDVREMCEQWSQSTGIPFYMRSRPAIEWIRQSLPVSELQKRRSSHA